MQAARISAAIVLTILGISAGRAESAVERGKYLVTLGGCNDCHTPGYFFGKPDFGHALSGSDVAFSIPGLGAFPGRNLTPDAETGLGKWSDDEIITALTRGLRPDGRKLAPSMPWRALAALSHEDAEAIVAYLRSIPAVNHAVPGPFKPGETPSLPVFVIVPGETYAKMPKPD